MWQVRAAALCGGLHLHHGIPNLHGAFFLLCRAAPGSVRLAGVAGACRGNQQSQAVRCTDAPLPHRCTVAFVKITAQVVNSLPNAVDCILEVSAGRRRRRRVGAPL